MAFARYFGIFIFIAMVTPSQAQAQENRYMVFFKDKSGSAYSVNQPQAFLSARAIERRVKHNIAVTEQDLPVNANYVQGVKQTGADVFFRSKWFNGVLVQCEPSIISAIEELSFVDHVDFVAPEKQLILNGGRKKFNLKNGRLKEEVTESQLQQLGMDDMHEAGIRGEGVLVAIFDAGFFGVNIAPAFSHLFDQGRIDLEVSHNFVYNTKNIFDHDDHGTEVFSIIAAEIPDAFTGGAPEANFQLYVTEDGPTEYRIEEYNWTFAAERADSAGVDIVNSSLGYSTFDDAGMNYTTAQMDGKTAVTTKAAQWAADRGMLIVVSAGNEFNLASWKIIAAPADAVDVLAVGGVDANGVKVSSSSGGPSADNRIKPDVVARGSGVKMVTSNGNVTSGLGTSYAAPLITALVTGVWQNYPDLTNKELITLVKSSASQASRPDNLLGYGIPNFEAIVKNYELEHQPQPELFAVFPNPTQDTVFIRPQDPAVITSCGIELITAQGQRVLKDTAEFSPINTKYLLDMHSLASGLYYVRIWYQHKSFVFKVVKD